MNSQITNKHEREVILKTALTSRLLLIVLQYVSNLLIPDHDADAFRFPKSSTYGILDQIVSHFFGGFLRWDAHHFMHISLYGYSYEHSLAFFPLCPYLVKILVTFLSFLSCFNLESLTLSVFLIVNTICFIQSALCLYELSLHIVNKDLAYKASILFCFNPASIFFSAPYTECLFSYLTFKCMLNSVLLYKKYCDIHSHLQVKDIVYIIPVSLSTVTRSNGVLNLGFLLYTFGCLYLAKMKLKKQIVDKVLCTLNFIMLTLFITAFCVLPFVIFELYSFQFFCKDFETYLPQAVLKHKDINDFVLPGTFSKHNQTWCFKTIPLAYSYVQSHYWKVGFLQYYEWKQVPNFLLAFPLIFILFEGSFQFFRQFPKNVAQVITFTTEKPSIKSQFSPAMMVFIIHSMVLTIFCILNVHIQVTTRMLCSASPVLYWLCASNVSNLDGMSLMKKLKHRRCSREYFIIGYFLSYFVVGTVMFCNFLPWT